MKPHIKLLRAATALVASVLGAGGAVGAHASDAPSEVASAPSPEVGDDTSGDPLRLAVIGSFTGPKAPQSVPMLDGIEMAVEHLNDNGGVNGEPVELIVRDDQGELGKTVAAARELQGDDRFAAFFVGGGTAPALAVQDLLADDGRPVFHLSVSPEISVESFPNHFRLNPLADVAAHNVFEHVAQEGVTKIGLLHVESGYGDSIAAAATTVAEELGIEIVADVRIPADARDATSQVRELQDAGAEYVYCALLPFQQPAALSAAQQIGFSPTWLLGGADVGTIATRELLGDQVDNVRFSGADQPFFDPALQDPATSDDAAAALPTAVADFWALWNARHPAEELLGRESNPIPSYEWLSYDATHIVAQLVADDTPVEELVAGIEAANTLEGVGHYEDLGETHEMVLTGTSNVHALSADGSVTFNLVNRD